MLVKEVALGLLLYVVYLSCGRQVTGLSVVEYDNSSPTESKEAHWLDLLVNVLKTANHKQQSNAAYDWSGAETDAAGDWSSTTEGEELWTVATELTNRCHSDLENGQSETSSSLLETWCDAVQSTCALGAAARGGEAGREKESTIKNTKRPSDAGLCGVLCSDKKGVAYYKCCQQVGKRNMDTSKRRMSFRLCDTCPTGNQIDYIKCCRKFQKRDNKRRISSDMCLILCRQHINSKEAYNNCCQGLSGRGKNEGKKSGDPADCPATCHGDPNYVSCCKGKKRSKSTTTIMQASRCGDECLYEEGVEYLRCCRRHSSDSTATAQRAFFEDKRANGSHRICDTLCKGYSGAAFLKCCDDVQG